MCLTYSETSFTHRAVEFWIFKIGLKLFWPFQVRPIFQIIKINDLSPFLGAKSPLEMAIVINWLINWLSQWTKSCYRVQLNTILKDIDESVNMIWNWNIQLKFSIDIWNLILIFEIKFWYQNLNSKLKSNI